MSYGKVQDAFWESERIDSLSDGAALLALFLLTGPHRNAIGCFKLGAGAITDVDRFGKWGIEGVSRALTELSDRGFIVRDDRTGWTFIINALKHDPIKGSKAAIHALSLLQRVPQKTLVYSALIERLLPQLETESKHLEGKPGWPIEGVSEGDPIPKPSPSPLPEPSPEPSTANAVSASDDAPSPPVDLKSQIFGPCLRWLADKTGRPEKALRSVVGKWCSQYGDGPALEALMAAQRVSTPVEPIAYVEKLLRTGGPRDGPHSQARQSAVEDEVDRMILEAAREADRRNDQQQRTDHGAVEPLELGFRAPDGEDHQRPAEPEVRRSGGGLRGIATALPALGTGGRH